MRGDLSPILTDIYAFNVVLFCVDQVKLFVILSSLSFSHLAIVYLTSVGLVITQCTDSIT